MCVASRGEERDRAGHVKLKYRWRNLSPMKKEGRKYGSAQFMKAKASASGDG